MYGVRKVWNALGKQHLKVARCTVARLMRQLGVRGVFRGKTVRTTFSDKALPCPQDRINRQFRSARPNGLWGSDFTFVHTWQGFAYVAFVIDTCALRLVGWRVSGAGTHGLCAGCAGTGPACTLCPKGGLTDRSERGGQYVSTCYT